MHRTAVRSSAVTAIGIFLLCSLLPGSGVLAAEKEMGPVFTACAPGAEPAGKTASRTEPGNVE